MPLDPGGSADNPDGTDDNEGPHCRNCHSGANSCDQCHGESATGVARGAYSTVPLTGGKTVWQPGSYLHTSAVAGLSGQCIDGGFSFPHRTLGANMLKDELYGVDFDGTPIGVGETRSNTIGLDTANYALSWAQSHTTEATGSADFMYGWTENGEQIESTVENLDSVCIDCHGDSTYWNGDDPATYKSADGWDLLFKGLP